MLDRRCGFCFAFVPPLSCRIVRGQVCLSRDTHGWGRASLETMLAKYEPTPEHMILMDVKVSISISLYTSGSKCVYTVSRVGIVPLIFFACPIFSRSKSLQCRNSRCIERSQRVFSSEAAIGLIHRRCRENQVWQTRLGNVV